MQPIRITVWCDHLNDHTYICRPFATNANRHMTGVQVPRIYANNEKLKLLMVLTPKQTFKKLL